MFTSARITLTLWYLLIIMTISILFSTIIYSILTREIIRFEQEQRTRIERRFSPFHISVPINLELIEEVKERILFNLFSINITILIISGGLGYFLAGKTLKPIQTMVEEQHRFISDSSHELKTPLTALTTSMEVYLRDKKRTLGNADSLIKNSLSQVKLLTNLSHTLLALSSYDAYPTHPQFSPVLLSKTITSAIQFHHASAKEKDITITSHTDSSVILGENEQLILLLQTIIENAITYSPQKSTITILSRAKDSHVILEIIDNGIGIDPKDLPLVFNRFYQSEQSRNKKDEKGFGLGLSIAKKIVELHKGTIAISSVKGQGTTVTISFPLYKKNHSSLS